MNSIELNIKTFSLQIEGIDTILRIPHSIFITNNVKKNKNGEIIFDVSLDDEYLNIIKEILSKDWFTFDRKDYYRSSKVYKITFEGIQKISIKNPIWTDDENNNRKLSSYTIIEEGLKQEPKLIVEDKRESHLSSLEKIDDLRKLLYS